MADEAEKVLSAARDGDIQSLQSLRKSVAFATDSFGATALHHATRYGKLDCVRWMVEKVGLKAKVKAKNGATALHDACTQGKLLCVKYFIQDCNLSGDVTDNSGHTPLHLAARFGYVEIVKWLINKAKCKPRLKTINRMNAVHFAGAGGHLQCLEFLISSGNTILLDERASDGTTPIFLASQNGHFPCLKYLHTVGAKCDFRSRDGMHLIHAAAQNGHLDCIGYLVVNGIASETEEDSTGATPAHYAAGEGHVPVLKWLNKRCDLNIKDQLGGTPLHDASEKGQFAAIQYLVDHAHLSLKLKDKSNLSPIDLTDKYGHNRCHEFLKETAAKSNQVKAAKMMTYSNTFDKQTVEVSTGSSFLHVLKKKPRQMDRPPSPSSTAVSPLSPLYCSPNVSPRTTPIPCMIEYGKASEWRELDDEDVSKEYPHHASEVHLLLEDHSNSQREHLLDTSGMKHLYPVDDDLWKRKLGRLTPMLRVDAYSNNVEGARKFDDWPQEELTDEILDAAKNRTRLMNERLYNGNPTPSPLHNFDARSGETAARNFQEFTSKIQAARAKRSPHNTITKNDYQVLIPGDEKKENEKMEVKDIEKETAEVQNDSMMECNDLLNPNPGKSSFEEKMLPRSVESSPKPIALNPSPPIPKTLTDIFQKPKPKSPSTPVSVQQRSPPKSPTPPKSYEASPKLYKVPTQTKSQSPVRSSPSAAPKLFTQKPEYGAPIQRSKPQEDVEPTKETEVDENEPPIDDENYMTTDDETEKTASLPRTKIDKDEVSMRKRQLQPPPHLNGATPNKFGAQQSLDEDTWRTLPEWKRQVLRNRIMKEQQVDLETRKREEEEISKYVGIPAWKVPIVQRKESDRRKQEKKFSHLPEWKRDLISKSQK